MAEALRIFAQALGPALAVALAGVGACRARGSPRADQEGASAASVAADNASAPLRPGAPCSDPGYAPGPVLRPIAGLPPFEVTFNCLWPSHEKMEVAVALGRTEELPSRAQIEALLRGIWRQAEKAMGAAFPKTMKVCAMPSGTKGWDGKPLGCLRKGYEPEGEGGEADEVELRLDMPLDPAAYAESLEKRFGAGFVGAHKPRVTFDAIRRELTMTYPHVDAKTDAWVSRLSYADATVPLFALAWEFYPPKTSLRTLTYVGVWKGKTVVKAHIDDLAMFLAMDPWPIRERLELAGIPLRPDAARTPEQNAAIRAAFEPAFAKLPEGGITIDPGLTVAARR